MFVSKRRWILKTCGSTTTLACLEPLLRLASEIAGYGEIEELFYSRKNFKRPELQVSPHRGFDEEVAFLDSFFEDGRAYSLGAINRDCWHLYTLSRGGGGSGKLEQQFLASNNINMNANNMITTNNKQQQQQQQHQQVVEMTPSAKMNLIESLQLPDPDQTIEILMTDLDPKVMAVFTKDVCSTALEATQVGSDDCGVDEIKLIRSSFLPQKSGIHKLIPGMVIDDYLFDPCGYSMNGVSKSVSIGAWLVMARSVAVARRNFPLISILHFLTLFFRIYCSTLSLLVLVDYGYLPLSPAVYYTLE